MKFLLSIQLTVSIAIYTCAETQKPIGNVDSSAENDDSGNNNDYGDPWETPFQELSRMTPICKQRVEGFDQIAFKAEVAWQKCMDSINPNIPELANTDRADTTGDKVNASVFHEIEKKVYMSICGNTTAFKSCWTGVLDALNECEKGAGDVSGKLYFALYDDICRGGGKYTIENRRRAETQGKLCDRDYYTKECRMNRHLQDHPEFYDLCRRFRSIISCDRSSIASNCPNLIDKFSHEDIFNRVGVTLDCMEMKQSDETQEGYSSAGQNYSLSINVIYILCFWFAWIYCWTFFYVLI